ncbi:MAG: hypothetical protein HWE14_14010 [Flavobacteriia bacterium]|nr:hypothetical protein [Flavobacteriia bacterium]
MKTTLLYISLLLTTLCAGQPVFEGFVRAGDNGEPVPQVYIVNLRTETSVLTNNLGFFSMDIETGDSLLLSHLAFSFTYYVIPDSISEDRHIAIIDMEPRNYLIDEVSVESYKLTTNKPRRMKLEEPNVPDVEDVEYPDGENVKPGFSSPVDLLYWYFGSRPRQLRELRRLQQEDAYREQLRAGSNREILIAITGLSPEELEAFAYFCKYGDQPISTINDYDLLVSLLNCYSEYLEFQEKEQVLQDAESGW